MKKKSPINSILTDSDVISIRNRAWLGERVDYIYKDYLKIKKTSFYDALNGKTWKRITSPPPFEKNKLEKKICSCCWNRVNIENMSRHMCKNCINKKRQIKENSKKLLTFKIKKPKKQKIINPKIILCESIKNVIKNIKLKEKRNNPKDKIIFRIRKSIRSVLKGGPSKGGWRHLNYTKNELINHLYRDIFESIKLEEYHIDHIKPICSFDPEKLKDPMSDEFQECWSLSNLRLIKATDNLKKVSEDIKLKFVKK